MSADDMVVCCESRENTERLEVSVCMCDSPKWNKEVTGGGDEVSGGFRDQPSVWKRGERSRLEECLTCEVRQKSIKPE